MAAASTERRYYISSRVLDAEQAAHAVRAHWLIESQLHWVLDMSFGEDACTVRTQHAAHNLALIRHFAFNLLRRAKDERSLRMRQRRCHWDCDYRQRQPDCTQREAPRPRAAGCVTWTGTGRLQRARP